MTKLYNIRGFRIEDGLVRPLAVEGLTIEQHYKDECRRLDVRDRADLDRVNVGPTKSSVDVDAGESVSIALRYLRRSVDENGSLVENVATEVSTTFEVAIEDPNGETSTASFSPTSGEASFSLTPDVVGTWTIRSVVESDDFVDEYATVEAI